MKQKDLHRLLARAGFRYREGHGRHRVWRKGPVSCVTYSDEHKEAPEYAIRRAQAAIKEASDVS